LTVKKFRRRAEICLRFAVRVNDPTIAQYLRLMASEYLAAAEAAEITVASASTASPGGDKETEKEA
jgi:hypothetical protein